MPFHVGSEPKPASSSHERRVALVIGNSAYRHASELANPVNDAEAIAAILARLGFDVVKGLNLDLRAMGDVQEAFEAKLRSKPDIALLYYGGHGLQVKGFNYLVPIDAEIDAQAHLSSRAIRFNDIFDPMAEEAGASLIFLDACRDNPFTRNLARSLGEGARSASIRGGLARVEKVAGTFIAYATAPDMVAFDGKGKNSPFTAALLRHIETPGLSVADVMIDVRNSVLEETKGRQEPWDQSSLRARFCFVPKIEEPKTEVAIKPLQLSATSDEWAAIQHTTSLAVLARFKEHHPEPPWCDYADARADELRTADEARRKAMEAERPKKTEGSTASHATGALMSERPTSPQLSPLDDKLSAPKANAVQPQTGTAATHDTGARWHIGVALTYALAALPVVLLSGILFRENRWTFLGGGSGKWQSGYIVGGVLVAALAVILARRRGQALTGRELTLYWLGAALSIAPLMFALFGAWSLFDNSTRIAALSKRANPPTDIERLKYTGSASRGGRQGGSVTASMAGWKMDRGKFEASSMEISGTPAGDGKTSYYIAPESFLGNWMGRQSLSFEKKSWGGSYYDPNSYAAYGDVVLRNGSMSARYDIERDHSGEWRRYHIPLTSGRWVFSGGARSLADILPNVTEFRIRAEYGVGADYSALRNVELR